MYYPELKKLIYYNITKENICKLDEYLNYSQKYNNNIYSINFAHAYNLNYNTAHKLLFYAVHINILCINYEIYCPYCNYYFKEFKINTSIDIPYKTISCIMCNKTFNPHNHLDKILISFIIKKNIGD